MTEEAKNKILEALRSGVDVEGKLDDVEDYYVGEKEVMEQDEWDKLLEETREEFSSDPDAQLKANFKTAYKEVIYDKVRYNGKPLDYEDFTNPNLDIEDITILSTVLKNPPQYEKWLKSVKGFKLAHSEFLTENDKDSLDAIVNRIAEFVERGASITQIDRAELLPEQLVRGFLNFELQEDRDDIYAYWRKIGVRYYSVVHALARFQIAADNSNLDEGMIEDINNLKMPPNYIGSVPPITRDIKNIYVRIGEWVAFTGQAIAEAKEHALSGEFFSRGEPRDFKDMKLEDRLKRGKIVPEWRREDIAEHGQREPTHELDEQEFDKQTADFEDLDPYYAYELENQFNFPIRTLEVEKAKRILNKWLETTKRRGDMKEIEKVLHKKVLEIQLQAHKSTGNKTYHLPYTDWVLSRYTISELGEEAPKISEITGKFFDELSNILFELKGQEQVDSPKEGSKFTGVQVGDKVKDIDISTYQQGIEPVPRKFDDENLKDSLKSLLEKLDEYYFTPIIGKDDLFVGGIPPRFATDLEGARSFNLIGIEFSNHPPLQQTKNIHAKLEDNVNLGALKKVRDYLKQETTSETQQNTQKYIDDLVELVDALTLLFEDEQWAIEYAAYQLNLYLKGKGSVNKLSNLKIKDANAQKSFDAFNKRGGRGKSIVYSLRAYLSLPRFKKLIAEQEKMGISVSQYNTVTNEILNLTEPERQNKIPDVAKSLLETHDVVRKMKGKEIVYGKLSLYNVDAMDYIITKMDNKYNVDITAMDVMTIAKSCDSFQSLSNNHGLSQEVIYEIKGLCR